LCVSVLCVRCCGDLCLSVHPCENAKRKKKTEEEKVHLCCVLCFTVCVCVWMSERERGREKHMYRERDRECVCVSPCVWCVQYEELNIQFFDMGQ